jgi:hypothetical protein
MNLHDDRPVSQVVGDIIAKSQEILRSEVRLAKTEIKEEAAAWAKSFAVLAAGLLLAVFALGLLLLGAVYALSNVVEPWAAAVIVGVAIGILAALLGASGKRRLDHVDLKPEKTIATVKENIQWVKHQARQAR